MGYEICDFDDDMGQSVLVQQEQHTIQRKNEQLCNSAEETDGKSESVRRKATMMEQLVGDAHVRMRKKTLKTAASITIATWLDELHDLRQKIKHGQTESIIMGHANAEDLLKASVQFKRKINAARSIAKRTDRQGVGEQVVDTSTEEPPE